MDKLQEVRQNEQLRTLLMTECDIYFYDNVSEVQFSGNNEEYSLACKAFAQDGSGGEYVFLEDNSIGFIGSEGQVGRVAESLDDLLTFLLHAGCISDFSCRYLYQNTDLLKAFCKGYVAKIRESYQTKQEDRDQVRGNMAQKLSLDFNPEKLEEVAMTFYQSATREPVFFCKYTDGEEEYACDSVLSDIVGLWTTELVGMSREESVLMISFQCESKLVSMLKDLSYDILGRNCQYGWTRNLHRKIGEVLFWIPYFTF